MQREITEHWNNRARTYQSNMLKDFMTPLTYGRWCTLLVPFLEPAKTMDVLDAGCGTGVLSHIVANHGGHRIVASDVSEKMIQVARENLSPWPDRIEFICRDVTDLPLPDKSFDLILSRNVVWTLPCPERAVREWQRLLKPGGKLVIIDGNWYRGFYSSFIVRAWMKFVHCYYRLRNRKLSGQELAHHYAQKLPHTHLLRPDWDMGLLAGAGFRQIQVCRNLDRIVYAGSLKRLVCSFARPFLIQGVKQ